MIRENFDRNTAVFYTCGVCNLNCRYCGIDKNPILKKIDEALEKSFEGDYYFNRVKQYFPRKDMLRKVETWGGEPFLRMDRIHPLIHQLIQHYPYFDQMYSSTNFSYSTWIDQIFGLFDCFGAYPYRDFHYCLQLSVDGPEYINDAGRGQGVTKRCLENFDKLVEALKAGRLPKNVYLMITLKGTLDNDSINKLCSREALIDYYKFYEGEFIDKIRTLNMENVNIALGIPNTAVPSPVTVENGKTFAQLVKLCREIEEDNRKDKIFKYYDEITPFCNDITQTALTYKYGYHTCGTGDCTIGFLPDNMLSSCHEGFTQIVEDYKRVAATSDKDYSSITFDKNLSDQKISMCVDDEGYAEHERKMKTYCNDCSSCRLASSVPIIMSLALAGQIDRKYITEENALKAAIFLQGHTSFCIKDNYNKTGSYTTQPIGIYKLLLNGAMEYIQHEGEMKVEC